MKAVLQSIKPKYCYFEAIGLKNIEIRKTKPNIPTPFKVYIYCTKPKERFSIGKHIYAFADNLYFANNIIKYGDGFEDVSTDIVNLNGKIIGEYICNEIETLRFDALDQACIMREAYGHSLDEEFKTGTCVSYKEVRDYCSNLTWNENNTDFFYGWHISDLKIYDEPKELIEFMKPLAIMEKIIANDGSLLCDGCSDANWKCGHIRCSNSCCEYRIITRPPQSWCYVEKR
ncbi:MAG: hypothetical protein ACI37Z_05255 [Candidatus Gastranaerophilaceae bacterium]